MKRIVSTKRYIRVANASPATPNRGGNGTEGPWPVDTHCGRDERLLAPSADTQCPGGREGEQRKKEREKEKHVRAAMIEYRVRRFQCFELFDRGNVGYALSLQYELRGDNESVCVSTHLIPLHEKAQRMLTSDQTALVAFKVKLKTLSAV